MIIQIVKEMNWKKNIFQWRVKVYEDGKHYPNCIYERMINEYGNKYEALFDAVTTMKEMGINYRCSNSDVDCVLQSSQANAIIEMEHYNYLKKRLDS